MKKEVIFSLPAEAVKNASKVCLMGDFNDWTSTKEFELEIRPDGSASIAVPLETGKTYRYRFLVDDTVWVNDYHAEKYEPVDGYGIDNCVITVSADQPAKTAAKTKSPAKKKSGITAKKTAARTAKAKPAGQTKTAHKRTARKKITSSDKTGQEKA